MFTKTALAVALIGVGSSGCGIEGDPEVRAAFEEKITPIVLKVARNAPIADPKIKAVVLVGTFALEAYLKRRSKREFESNNDTVLTVRQTINGSGQVSVLRIKTGRKLRIEMDGKFVQHIEKDRIDITAEPGSTILITDTSDNDKIHQYGTFALIPPDNKSHTHVDLDAGRAQEYSPAADFKLSPWIQGVGLQSVNGALTRVARWKEEQPSRTACSELPSDRWKDKTDSSLFLETVTYCVRTNENRYGIVTYNTTVSHFRFVVWKNPGEKG